MSKRFKIFLAGLIIFSIILISFGRITTFAFWHDDYTHLYKAQQNIKSTFPYQFFSLATPFLYNFFGTNAQGYFVVGILFYFISAVLLFYLIYEVFDRNKIIAFLGTLLYSAGYIGQGSLIMFVGDGIGTLPILPLVIIGFTTYIHFFKSRKTFFLLFTYIFVTGVFMLAPHRYPGLVLPFVLIDWYYWFLEGKKGDKVKAILLRNVLFILLFLSFYATRGRPGVVESLTLENIFIQLANFWNFVFPSYVQEKLTVLPVFPVYTAFVWIFWVCNKKKRIFYTLVFVATNLIGSVIARDLIKNSLVQQESINGFLLVALIVLSLSNRIRGRLLVFGVILTTGLSTFFVAASLATMESSYRYLMAYSFTSSILVLSLFAKNDGKYKSKKDYVGIVIPLIVMIVLRLFSAIQTQSAFYNNYSLHFNKIYSDLKRELPAIDKPVLLYMEGTTKELNFVVGDASRVGELPTQAAFAVYYGVLMSNIVWPETMNEITNLKSAKKIDSKNIYTFIYDGDDLINTAERTRDMLTNPTLYRKVFMVNKNVSLPSVIYSKTESEESVYSQVQLMVNLEVRNAENKETTLQVQWDYDSYGPLTAKKNYDFELLPNENKKFVFQIDAGGRFIKEMRIVSLDGEPNLKLQIQSLVFAPNI